MIDNDAKDFRGRFKKYAQPLMYSSCIVPALFNMLGSIGRDYILSTIPQFG